MKPAPLFGTLLLALLAPVARCDVAWPCVGRPAIAAPGGEIALGDGTSGPVQLVSGETRHTLDVQPGTGDLATGTDVAAIPDSVSPGRYDLVLQSSGGSRQHRRAAVFVLGETPVSYTIAVLRAGENPAEGIPLFPDTAIARVAESDAALVFVIGTLTRDGSPAEYAALQEAFGALDAPVFFCPDTAERVRGDFEVIFGPPDYGIRFGADGYLLMGGGLAHRNSGAANRIGPLHRWRRVLRPSRWSIGVAARFGLDWSMRSQLTLFVDDPLDYLLAGKAPDGMPERLPWGRTRLALAPAASLHLLTVDPGGLRVLSAPAAPASEPASAPADSASR